MKADSENLTEHQLRQIEKLERQIENGLFLYLLFHGILPAVLGAITFTTLLSLTDKAQGDIKYPHGLMFLIFIFPGFLLSARRKFEQLPRLIVDIRERNLPTWPEKEAAIVFGVAILAFFVSFVAKKILANDVVTADALSSMALVAGVVFVFWSVVLATRAKLRRAKDRIEISRDKLEQFARELENKTSDKN